MLFDIHRLRWDDEILARLGIPHRLLPAVAASSHVFGEATVAPLGGATIAAVAGDQQAATFGQACFEAGQAKNTYGTGCFLMLNTGNRTLPSDNKLLTTIAWQRHEAITYALEGSIFVAGAVVQWLRDGLGIIDSAAEVEPLARQVPDNGGVYFVPAFTGLGAPHWDQYARGAVLGLTRGTNAAHLAPGRTRRDRLSGLRGARGHDRRRRRLAYRTAGRWRRLEQRPVDAVPGRPPQRACGAARRSPKRPPWARPTWPASRSDSGPTKRRSHASGL